MNTLRSVVVMCVLLLLLLASASAQWVQTNGPYGGTVNSFAVSGTNLFAGTNSGVFLSTNSGASWSQAGLTNSYVLALAVSGTNLLAGTNDIGGVAIIQRLISDLSEAS